MISGGIEVNQFDQIRLILEAKSGDNVLSYKAVLKVSSGVAIKVL